MSSIAVRLPAARLNKITHATGRPVRDHRAALALYLACLADQLDDEG